MHNQGGMGGSSSMDHESHLAHHDHNYGHDQWGEMGTFMQTTMPEYAHGYGYMPSFAHRLPSESLGHMPPPATPPPPPPPSHVQHSGPPSHHPTLPMLMVPSHPTWPSMLTNPGGFNTSPPVAIPPISAGIQSLKPSTRLPVPPVASQPRKTLTDDDRRRMCQWHIDHPEMKQTEIGAMFHVERSTVSKVLSRKDKWLNPEERSNSPIKKTKGKIPDIDKTLANWLRNEQHRGRHVSDSEIQEQARMYARPFREAETKINNPSWLEKFKHKHGMSSSRLTRRASETNIPKAAAASKLATPSPISQPSSALSSASPGHRPSASPFSGLREGADEDKENGSSAPMLDFNEPPSAGTVNQFHQCNLFKSETTGSSFSDNTASPSGTGQFTFSPNPNSGGFLAADQARHMPPGGSNFHRPRSQTFPTLDLEYMNGSEQGTPRIPSSGNPHSTAPSSALESPAHEFASAGPFGLDGAISPHPQPAHHPLQHSNSSSSLQGRMQQRSTTPVIGSAPLSSVASSPISPSQEDARRAADTLLTFIANSGPNSMVDQSDYNAVIRLTEKLRLHQQAQAQAASASARGQQQLMGMGLGMGISMGGLDRIPEGDAEMGGTGQHVEAQGNMIKTENMMRA